jgi:hypothetical protein
MKRIAAIVCAACLSTCLGCSDAPLAVAQRSSPPKPAAPAPGDKGDDEPAIPAPLGSNNPNVAPVNPTPINPVPAPGNPALVPTAPGTIPAAGPAIPGANPTVPGTNPAIPNAGPANPGLNPNLIPVVPGANPAPLGPVPAIPGANPAAPVATPPGVGAIPPIPGASPATPGTTPAAPAANPFANILSGNTTPATPPAATPPANVTVAPAAPGAGEAGKDYGNGDAGFITKPISTYFGIREQLVYDQIKHNMDIYRATHYGFPKTQAEFDKEILEPSNIHLPDLPQGSTYHYNPKSGEYEVWTPK